MLRRVYRHYKLPVKKLIESIGGLCKRLCIRFQRVLSRLYRLSLQGESEKIFQSTREVPTWLLSENICSNHRSSVVVLLDVTFITSYCILVDPFETHDVQQFG